MSLAGESAFAWLGITKLSPPCMSAVLVLGLRRSATTARGAVEGAVTASDVFDNGTNLVVATAAADLPAEAFFAAHGKTTA